MRLLLWTERTWQRATASDTRAFVGFGPSSDEGGNGLSARTKSILVGGIRLLADGLGLVIGKLAEDISLH